MVYLTEAAMDRLKGKTPHAKSLEMTPDEKARAGQYFRIQIPIRDRGALGGNGKKRPSVPISTGS
jgi:hypothetical protein